MKKVANKNRKFGADPYYFHVKSGGVDYLFTEEQKDAASKRAKNSPEDVPKSIRVWQIEDVVLLIIVLSTFVALFAHYLLTHLN